MPLGSGLKAMTPKRSWRDRWVGLEWAPAALTDNRFTPDGVENLGVPQLLGFAECGWRIGNDDPLLGAGRFLIGVTGQ
eukprot:6285735-Alexandrium_andersonii.AAC.1